MGQLNSFITNFGVYEKNEVDKKNKEIQNQLEEIKLKNEEINIYLKMIEAYKKEKELQAYLDFLLILRKFKEVNNIFLLNRDKKFRSFLHKQKIKLPRSRSFNCLDLWVNNNFEKINTYIKRVYKVNTVFPIEDVKLFLKQKKE